MIRKKRHLIGIDDESCTILITYYNSNNNIKVFKNDLPISILLNRYYVWDQCDYLHRDNDLPDYIGIYNVWYAFTKFNIPYRYSGYTDMFFINDTKKYKFIKGICFEQLKMELDVDNDI